jgi:hypothetical protein
MSSLSCQRSTLALAHSCGERFLATSYQGIDIESDDEPMPPYNVVEQSDY